MHAFYSDGLSYREVHNLKIGKGNFKSYFVNPKMGEEMNGGNLIFLLDGAHIHA